MINYTFIEDIIKENPLGARAKKGGYYITHPNSAMKSNGVLSGSNKTVYIDNGLKLAYKLHRSEAHWDRRGKFQYEALKTTGVSLFLIDSPAFVPIEVQRKLKPLNRKEMEHTDRYTAYTFLEVVQDSSKCSCNMCKDVHEQIKIILDCYEKTGGPIKSFCDIHGDNIMKDKKGKYFIVDF